MEENIYPGCTPEFRILEHQDGTQVLQIRQINHTYGYVSKWEAVPVVKERMIKNFNPE